MLLIFIVPAITIAQSIAPGTGKDARILISKTTDFEITGNGSAKEWEKSDWLVLPSQTSSGVTYQTNVKLLYSDKGIYALYWCEDNIITSTLTKHQSDLWNEDVVEIFFWTDEQYPIYFEYELSPLNYELVLLVPNMEGKFLGWIPWHYEGDRLISHETKIVEEKGQVKGWYAEFFIPYSLLQPLSNVPPKKGATWRTNIYRIDYDKGISTWVWQPIRKTFHDIQSFGTLVFN